MTFLVVVQLKAARLAEVLWHSKTLRSGLTLSTLGSATGERDSASGSSSAPSRVRATARAARAQLGKDILKDYETVSIGQSAYFTGAAPPFLPCGGPAILAMGNK